MLELILYALLTGFILSFGFGSVFFSLIQNSLEYGFKSGIKMAVGVSLSDVILIFLAIAGTSFLPQIPYFEQTVRLAGILLLLGLAISQFRTKKESKRMQKSRTLNFLYFFVLGFLLNILNPMNLLTWVMVSGTLKSYHLSLNKELLFFGICIGAILMTESLISIFAYNMKIFLNENKLRTIRYISALIFFGIACRLAWDLIQV